jgi:hypothetical protein
VSLQSENNRERVPFLHTHKKREGLVFSVVVFSHSLLRVFEGRLIDVLYSYVKGVVIPLLLGGITIPLEKKLTKQRNSYSIRGVPQISFDSSIP